MKLKKKGGKKVKVTITLTDSVWERLRIRSIREKTSASAIIDALVAEYLGNPKKKGGG